MHPSRWRRLLPAFLVALPLPACSDKTGPEPVPVVEVVAPADRVEVGRTLQLSARVRSPDGELLPRVSVTWSSSDESVAAVGPDGVVAGRAPGTAVIRAVAGKGSGSTTVTVVPVPVASVVVSPDTATLVAGSTWKLTAVLRDASGAVLTGRAVAWSSDDESVASVAPDGSVTARGEGTALIAAESEGKRGTSRIAVVLPRLPELRLERVASGLHGPAYLTAPPGDPRLFVVELSGRVRVIRDGGLLSTPFLDLGDRVKQEGEQGLLSVAFHPRYAANGQLYVYYNDRSGNIRVERYRVGADPDRADPASAKLVLSIANPSGVHNGGLMKFGPDGRLYVGTGEGGDPANAQDPGSLLGKVLRIDVDAGDPYAVPADNPFVGRPGARGEVWALGLRNPWRWSFDRETGLLYLADVGEKHWEEVNVVPAGAAGFNFGWSRMEGSRCYPAGSEECDPLGTVLPVLEYPHPANAADSRHPAGCSVTGGYVYRGRRMPALRGHYFYADFCKLWVRSFRYQGGKAVEQRQWEGLGGANAGGLILSFGEDAAGELYLLAGDKVFRIVPGS